jgi:hypothetical protein
MQTQRSIYLEAPAPNEECRRIAARLRTLPNVNVSVAGCAPEALARDSVGAEFTPLAGTLRDQYCLRNTKRQSMRRQGGNRDSVAEVSSGDP